MFSISLMSPRKESGSEGRAREHGCCMKGSLRNHLGMHHSDILQVYFETDFILIPLPFILIAQNYI